MSHQMMSPETYHLKSFVYDDGLREAWFGGRTKYFLTVDSTETAVRRIEEELLDVVDGLVENLRYRVVESSVMPPTHMVLISVLARSTGSQRAFREVAEMLVKEAIMERDAAECGATDIIGNDPEDSSEELVPGTLVQTRTSLGESWFPTPEVPERKRIFVHRNDSNSACGGFFVFDTHTQQTMRFRSHEVCASQRRVDTA